MTNFWTGVKGFTLRTLLLSCLLACFSIPAWPTDEITGHVHNRTRGQAWAGAEVILLRLDQGMTEEARTITDGAGKFTLKVVLPDKLHLVRVTYEGVSYDQRASAGEDVSLDVFDVAQRVRGVSGSIEIIRTGTNGNLLHISDMYEIRNDSRPRMTQGGERAFEVYLPADAKIDSILAAGPDRISVMISAAAVQGEPGHYTVNFPLRPGATKFAFNYDLPYEGHAAFHTRRLYALQQLAVMIPPSMKFSSNSPVFQILPTGNPRYQVYAGTQLRAGKGPEFEVQGTGAFPPLSDEAGSQAQSKSAIHVDATASAGSIAAQSFHGRRDLAVKQARTPSQPLLLGGLSALLLAASAFLVMHARKTRQP